MAELVLHVPDIDEAGKDYAFELAPAWLDVLLQDATLRADPESGPGALSVHVQQNGTEYLVTGQLRAQLLTECGRCLADAKVPVDVEIAALYVRGHAAGAPAKSPSKAPKAAKARNINESESRHPPRARGPGGQKVRELDAEELDVEDGLQREPFSGSEIVLDDLVREHMVLEVPMQPLCSEQCEGIPVPKHLRPPPDVFGESGTVDPRLAPLQRLRDNVPQKSAPSAHDAVRTGSAGPVGQQAPEKAAPDAKSNTAPNKQSINLPNKANTDTDKE